MDKTEEHLANLQIDLSPSEAIVLFELLSRFTENDTLSIEDDAEARVLWNLQAELETKLVEPLRSDYHELLKHAREEVKGGG